MWAQAVAVLTAGPVTWTRSCAAGWRWRALHRRCSYPCPTRIVSYDVRLAGWHLRAFCAVSIWSRLKPSRLCSECKGYRSATALDLVLV
ncbi:hypothetical protein EDB81DRAFT_790781 [Dactylonectria macrodidyma]|uniref:Uncharacterized protein n=1 Tax=Dactylonectria macrodidyma TaxID=307937 RepID=A0A9P9JB79_9HYPO|nr:hypothetical protein EDB81DRAFT_790781 [Dactylonectria macrodidyma]